MAIADRVARVTCTHDCPDACAMLVTVRDGRAIDVSPNPAHPVTGHHLCVKVDRYLERVYHPDRLLTPLRRSGPKGSGAFERISWDDALDLVANRWREIIRTDGAAAILPYSYLGSMGTLSAFGTMHALFHRIGATRLERIICHSRCSSEPSRSRCSSSTSGMRRRAESARDNSFVSGTTAAP
jgi:anaerobic selenocysteine-containing dehydrogenase